MELPRDEVRKCLLPVEWASDARLYSTVVLHPRNAVSVSWTSQESILRRLRTLVSGLLRDVAMHDFDAKFCPPQMFSDLLRDHDGTVLATSATECDGQIAFAFMNVMRQQVNEQIGDARDEFSSLRERADVLCEARIPPR